MRPDGIHVRILKELADVITRPLLMTFEQSWESGEIQFDWKLSFFPRKARRMIPETTDLSASLQFLVKL